MISNNRKIFTGNMLPVLFYEQVQSRAHEVLTGIMKEGDL